ncbi:MAG: Surfeit locus 1 family protein [Paracoccus sp.]|nr:MAG: Surfeit locus 1 family protein [Paracoccus sp. (in: a-proteobacteria)]
MTPRCSPRRAGLIGAGIGAALLVAVLCGLGVWQVQRLQWKTDLIQQVEARLATPAIPAPAMTAWQDLDEADEYRRVTVTGQLDQRHEALVKAVTAYGAGFWVMSPLTTDTGWTVWINRGFVPQDRTAPSSRSQPQGVVTITGLLRMSQPGGAFLRANDPDADRWYSRDTVALAASRGLDRVAPYFIDADAGSGDELPIGGLTVVRFRNNHLGYALTWFAMALGLAAAATILLRRELNREA